MYPSLLAVILTILEESDLTAAPPPLLLPLTDRTMPAELFTKETAAAGLADTGVINNLGGGVLGLGGRSVTFTSMGAMREPSANWAWSRTIKPARAITQSGSLQDRSQTASRWDLKSWISLLL